MCISSVRKGLNNHLKKQTDMYTINVIHMVKSKNPLFQTNVPEPYSEVTMGSFLKQSKIRKANV